MRAARYITGWAAIRVTGAEPERFLRALAERGVPFWDAGPVKDYTVMLCLPAGRIKGLAPLAASVGCQCDVLAVRGLPALAGKARRRLSLAVVLAAVPVLLMLSLSRVWDIEITGNETIADGVIRQALAECGVDIGAEWMGFSQDGIRNGMILRLPKIRWMTVTMQGCRARVIIRERYDRPEPVPEKEYADIVSDRAGLVTAVHALRGTAEVSRGQMVLPGETVIGGYSTGRFGDRGPTRAIGYAEIRAWHEMTARAPVFVHEKAPDGERYVSWALILGKSRINFYKDSSICPADCDKIIKRYNLSRPGAFTLPVALEKTVVTGYDTRPVRAMELRGELEELLSDMLTALAGEGGSVTEQRFSAAEADGLLGVTLRAECAEVAGVPAPPAYEEGIS